MNVHLAAEIKRHVSKPVATIGAINDPAMMEEILEKDQADVIDMARELLADPSCPTRSWRGRRTRLSMPAVLHLHGGTARHPDPPLRRQPLIGREIEGMEVVPVLRPKKVLVAGAECPG